MPGRASRTNAKWFVNTLAYTLAGALASVAIAATLSVTARSMVGPAEGELAGLGIIVVGLLCFGHCVGVLRLPLPHLRRQTNGLWAKEFRSTPAAALWGFDLGLTVTTWATFSGAWLLIAWIILSENALFASVLLLSYWLGRAASVWIVPITVRTIETSEVIMRINRQHPALRFVHITALIWTVSTMLVASSV